MLERLFGGGGGKAAADAGLVAFMAGDHRSCDELWAKVEQAADGGGDYASAFGAFSDAMLRHLDREEKVLFPAFEAASGMTSGGPTFVMRFEHDRMRAVLDEMADQVKAGDGNRLLDIGDTLMMLIQQHNAKEEGMLYPMAAQMLGDQWAEIRKQFG